MYEVLVSHEAEKYYKKQDKETRKRINRAIEALATEPLSGPHIKKLWGELEGKHRYALGGLRIVYQVDRERILVMVLSIRGRGDVYKR
ncbi:MAG: type II toxin-antitoxin system RelE/ParE family toxin [Nitrospirae bacterium]|nr:type II toxin-antitoxin system RelE/ParE family toxin [Nitrospirota bacterium]